jgi:hypothetical protein
MSAHSPNNSQCDLNMYGPDPGDGSVKCTCDEDAPVEPATTPRQGPAQAFPRAFPHLVNETMPAGAITLTGRGATVELELRDAGREYRAAQELFRKAEARMKAAIDAKMQEIQ